MSIDLSSLLAILWVKTPSAAVLSVCIGVGGCLWPIVSNAWRAGIASLQLTKRAPNSASAAEDGCVVFSDVVAQVVWAWLPIVAKFFLCNAAAEPV